MAAVKSDETTSDLEARRDASITSKTVKPSTRKDWSSTLWFPDDPGFKYYIRQEWLDLTTLVMMLLASYLLYKLVNPAPLRQIYFPLDIQSGQVIDSRYGYPKLDEFIGSELSAALSFGVPFAVMGLCGIFLIGNFWDTNSALKGLGFALCTSNFFQLMIKIFIGGPRPHFLMACRPRPGNIGGVGYTNIYYTRDICTNDSASELNEALMSFPSGHCTAAFAGFGFLALWVNAKFKVCADYKSRHWQLVLLMLPLCVGLLLALSKIADYWHHWWDVLVGSCIGMFFAVVAYRQTFYAVLDWEYNHIPLPYMFTEDPEAVLRPPTRGLTCINFAGWRNKHSKSEGLEDEKGIAQVDGTSSVVEIEDLEKGQMGLRRRLLHCTV